MNRAFRLRHSTEFSRVRRKGRSYSHPLVILIALPDPQGKLQIGISASRAVGKAVERNRAKRRLRASINLVLPQISRGWELIFIAREPIRRANFDQIMAGVIDLLNRADILQPEGTELSERERLSQ